MLQQQLLQPYPAPPRACKVQADAIMRLCIRMRAGRNAGKASQHAMLERGHRPAASAAASGDPSVYAGTRLSLAHQGHCVPEVAGKAAAGGADG